MLSISETNRNYLRKLSKDVLETHFCGDKTEKGVEMVTVSETFKAVNGFPAREMVDPVVLSEGVVLDD